MLVYKVVKIPQVERKRMSITQAQKPAFAFDIHKVLLNPDIWGMIRVLAAKKYSCLLMLIDPRFWFHIFYNGAIPERTVNGLVKTYHSLGVTKELLINVLAMQKPNLALISTLEKLHAHGYKLYVASNIWEKLFEATKDKFSFLQFVFAGYFIVSQKHNFIEKPNIHYFEQLKMLITAQNGDVPIVFVDDHRRNTQAAQKVGFKTITFSSNHQLFSDLKKMGIYVA